jgi:hypothetical protein
MITITVMYAEGRNRYQMDVETIPLTGSTFLDAHGQERVVTRVMDATPRHGAGIVIALPPTEDAA